MTEDVQQELDSDLAQLASEGWEKANEALEGTNQGVIGLFIWAGSMINGNALS